MEEYVIVDAGLNWLFLPTYLSSIYLSNKNPVKGQWGIVYNEFILPGFEIQGPVEFVYRSPTPGDPDFGGFQQTISSHSS